MDSLRGYGRKGGQKSEQLRDSTVFWQLLEFMRGRARVWTMGQREGIWSWVLEVLVYQSSEL